VDKAEAIRRRDEYHQQNQNRFLILEQGQASCAAGLKWIEEIGKPLVDRVTDLETDKLQKKAEKTGSAKTWGLIAAMGSAAAGIVGWVADRVLGGQH
jgi:hypothetical protein